ncbi:prephenate dehydratase [Thalassolituus sp.]|uniref:prephenate dehydratase n=2 Tax=Thalassolituus sp. TaxID=2030822 RepID=UPI0035198128
MARVAYQGTAGAYSHLACTQVFPEWEYLACDDFLSALDLVSGGFAERAMIPLENSTAGRVEEIYRLIPRTQLCVIAEHFEPVNHCLLALPGVSVEELKTVRSHPQALAQCHQRLLSMGLKAEAAVDTAMSARDLITRGDRTNAAIASSLAAELYGLDILQEQFQDVSGNTTRFLVFGREPEHSEYQSGIRYITSLLFSVRNMPAALYKALGGFATNGVNMAKLESYMDGGTMEASHFHLDIYGHPEQAHVRNALEELNYFASAVRILGSYPVHSYRKTTEFV